MSHASTFGKMAEQKATEHLQSLGYQILARNLRWRSKEIDIIAQENETLVIVELKARSSLYFGTPESFVSRRKITHLVEATNAYMDRHSLSFEVRFDIVSVFFSHGQWDIKHIPNSFYVF
ncbi:MAG: YraN family protein [Flavobacteriaceae bacterium]